MFANDLYSLMISNGLFLWDGAPHLMSLDT